MANPIDPRVTIGHIHLKVADLDRAVAFYSGVLGFDVVARMGSSAAFLSAGGYHHHIGLNTWESRNGTPPARGTTGLYHVAIRYPDRASLADALRRLRTAKITLQGASDHGVSEALYLADPDGNGLELYCDRPLEQWPRGRDGSIEMTTAPLDLEALLAEPASVPRALPTEGAASLTQESLERLKALRSRLITLHKALLDDARSAYEMDRGRIASTGALLQLVISDPWFAWLHQISEVIVRIDELSALDSAAGEGDARALFEQVDRLIIPSETGDVFAQRYFEALQRQPAVVLAHGELKRLLKQHS